VPEWDDDDLAAIAAADELQIAPCGSAGTLRPATTIRTVRVSDDVYVRSFNGRGGGWYRRAVATGHAHARAGGVDRDVTVQPADGSAADAIDNAYRAKYRRSAYLAPMISEQAAASTLQLMPED
jgi:hypothetical protein